MKTIPLDLHDYPADANVFHRTAVRGIVQRGDRYLLIRSGKYGDIKFPGGGAEQGESRTDTLIREMREETGFDVLRESVSEEFVVQEKRLGSLGDLLCMDSYYCRCEIGEEQYPQQLDDYELDEDYQVCWLTAAEAIRGNEAVSANKHMPWVQRELAVLRMLSHETEDKHMEQLNQVLDFLKEAGTYYIATVDGDRPRVRPFGAISEYEGKLYFPTNNQKKVFKQIQENPHIEICAMNGGGKWIRIEAEAVCDRSPEARKAVFEAHEMLASMYSLDDGIFEVLYLKNVSAVIASFTEPPVELTF